MGSKKADGLGRATRADGKERREAPGVSELQNHLADNLRRLRKDRGWTQEHIAATASLSNRAYQLLEAGGVNTTLATLVALAKALEVAPYELLKPAEE